MPYCEKTVKKSNFCRLLTVNVFQGSGGPELTEQRTCSTSATYINKQHWGTKVCSAWQMHETSTKKKKKKQAAHLQPPARLNDALRSGGMWPQSASVSGSEWNA